MDNTFIKEPTKTSVNSTQIISNRPKGNLEDFSLKTVHETGEIITGAVKGIQKDIYQIGSLYNKNITGVQDIVANNIIFPLDNSKLSKDAQNYYNLQRIFEDAKIKEVNSQIDKDLKPINLSQQLGGISYNIAKVLLISKGIGAVLPKVGALPYIDKLRLSSPSFDATYKITDNLLKSGIVGSIEGFVSSKSLNDTFDQRIDSAKKGFVQWASYDALKQIPVAYAATNLLVGSHGFISAKLDGATNKEALAAGLSTMAVDLAFHMVSGGKMEDLFIPQEFKTEFSGIREKQVRESKLEEAALESYYKINKEGSKKILDSFGIYNGDILSSFNHTIDQAKAGIVDPNNKYSKLLSTFASNPEGAEQFRGTINAAYRLNELPRAEFEQTIWDSFSSLAKGIVGEDPSKGLQGIVNDFLGYNYIVSPEGIVSPYKGTSEGFQKGYIKTPFESKTEEIIKQEAEIAKLGEESSGVDESKISLSKLDNTISILEKNPDTDPKRLEELSYLRDNFDVLKNPEKYKQEFRDKILISQEFIRNNPDLEKTSKDIEFQKIRDNLKKINNIETLVRRQKEIFYGKKWTTADKVEPLPEPKSDFDSSVNKVIKTKGEKGLDILYTNLKKEINQSLDFNYLSSLIDNLKKRKESVLDLIREESTKLSSKRIQYEGLSEEEQNTLKDLLVEPQEEDVDSGISILLSKDEFIYRDIKKLAAEAGQLQHIINIAEQRLNTITGKDITSLQNVVSEQKKVLTGLQEKINQQRSILRWGGEVKNGKFVKVQDKESIASNLKSLVHNANILSDAIARNELVLNSDYSSLSPLEKDLVGDYSQALISSKESVEEQVEPTKSSIKPSTMPSNGPGMPLEGATMPLGASKEAGVLSSEGTGNNWAVEPINELDRVKESIANYVNENPESLDKIADNIAITTNKDPETIKEEITNTIKFVVEPINKQIDTTTEQPTSKALAKTDVPPSTRLPETIKGLIDLFKKQSKEYSRNFIKSYIENKSIRDKDYSDVVAMLDGLSESALHPTTKQQFQDIKEKIVNGTNAKLLIREIDNALNTEVKLATIGDIHQLLAKPEFGYLNISDRAILNILKKNLTPDNLINDPTRPLGSIVKNVDNNNVIPNYLKGEIDPVTGQRRGGKIDTLPGKAIGDLTVEDFKDIKNLIGVSLKDAEDNIYSPVMDTLPGENRRITRAELANKFNSEIQNVKRSQEEKTFFGKMASSFGKLYDNTFVLPFNLHLNIVDSLFGFNPESPGFDYFYKSISNAQDRRIRMSNGYKEGKESIFKQYNTTNTKLTTPVRISLNNKAYTVTPSSIIALNRLKNQENYFAILSNQLGLSIKDATDLINDPSTQDLFQLDKSMQDYYNNVPERILFDYLTNERGYTPEKVNDYWRIMFKDLPKKMTDIKSVPDFPETPSFLQRRTNIPMDQYEIDTDIYGTQDRLVDQIFNWITNDKIYRDWNYMKGQTALIKTIDSSLNFLGKDVGYNNFDKFYKALFYGRIKTGMDIIETTINKLRGFTSTALLTLRPSSILKQGISGLTADYFYGHNNTLFAVGDLVQSLTSGTFIEDYNRLRTTVPSLFERELNEDLYDALKAFEGKEIPKDDIGKAISSISEIQKKFLTKTKVLPEVSDVIGMYIFTNSGIRKYAELFPEKFGDDGKPLDPDDLSFFIKKDLLRSQHYQPIQDRSYNVQQHGEYGKMLEMFRQEVNKRSLEYFTNWNRTEYGSKYDPKTKTYRKYTNAEKASERANYWFNYNLEQSLLDLGVSSLSNALWAGVIAAIAGVTNNWQVQKQIQDKEKKELDKARKDPSYQMKNVVGQTLVDMIPNIPLNTFFGSALKGYPNTTAKLPISNLLETIVRLGTGLVKDFDNKKKINAYGKELQYLAELSSLTIGTGTAVVDALFDLTGWNIETDIPTGAPKIKLKPSGSNAVPKLPKLKP